MTITFNSHRFNLTTYSSDTQPPENAQTPEIQASGKAAFESASANQNNTEATHHNSLALKLFNQAGLHTSPKTEETPGNPAPMTPTPAQTAGFFDWLPKPLPPLVPTPLPTPVIPEPINWDDVFGPEEPSHPPFMPSPLSI